MEQNIMDTVLHYVEILFIVIGAASALFAALSKITGLTTTDKDDKFVSGAQRFLSALLAILDRLGLNPDRDKARPPK